MSLPKKSFVVLFFVASMVVNASAAKANFIYTYTGNQFSTFAASGFGANAGTFVGHAISGEFTLSTALGDNFNGFVTPAQFSFTNGLVTLSNTQSPFYNFDIQTNSTGAIINWAITVNLSAGPAGMFIGTSRFSDGTGITGPTTFIGASDTLNPGSWSVVDPPSAAPLSATPLPSGLPLFVTGLGLVGLLYMRGKRERLNSSFSK